MFYTYKPFRVPIIIIDFFLQMQVSSLCQKFMIVVYWENVFLQRILFRILKIMHTFFFVHIPTN